MVHIDYSVLGFIYSHSHLFLFVLDSLDQIIILPIELLETVLNIVFNLSVIILLNKLTLTCSLFELVNLELEIP